MKHEATLRNIFLQPPSRLLSLALGREVAVRRSLSTDLIQVEDVHPDLLFETEDDDLIHLELHGYRMKRFAVRNLIYYALIYRDHGRPPIQIVLWYGRRPLGIPSGLDHPPHLAYRYRVIDVRAIDADVLLEGTVSDSVFAILCGMRNQRDTVARILRRIAELPPLKRREAIAQVLILSGLRELEPVVREEINRMPLTFDIHENTFLHGIHQEGREEGREEGRTQMARTVLLSLLNDKFGPLPKRAAAKLNKAPADLLQRWTLRVLRSKTIDDVFA